MICCLSPGDGCGGPLQPTPPSSHKRTREEGNNNSVIAQCIHRFRHQPAMSREERQKLREKDGSKSNDRAPCEEDFWWQSPPSSHKSRCGYEDGDSAEDYVKWDRRDDGRSSGKSSSSPHSNDKPITSPHLEEPLSSTSQHDDEDEEERWAEDDDRGDGEEGVEEEDVGDGDSDELDGSMQEDIDAEQRALECGDEDVADSSDLDTRAEKLLQKCKSVLEGFYVPDHVQRATEVSTEPLPCVLCLTHMYFLS